MNESEMQLIKRVTIFGAGLTGSWLLIALKKLIPSLEVRLIETRTDFDRSKTWSFHESDLRLATRVSTFNLSDIQNLVFPYVSTRWPEYRVRFSSDFQTVSLPYASIRARSFFEKFFEEFGASVGFGSDVDLGQYAANASSDELVLDCTGQNMEATTNQGFQKFLGLELRVPQEHGFNSPVVMDASLSQSDGLTFMYLLPWTATDILVELTRFSPSAHLEESACRDAIHRYATQIGWKNVVEIASERGVLPIPLIGKQPQTKVRTKVVSLGMAGGLFHPATGFSFGACMAAVMHVVTLIKEQHSSSDIYGKIEKYKTKMWRRGGYYRLLNNMQILGANDVERLSIYSQFYSRPRDLISRFYAGELSIGDKCRVLTGKPPMSISRACASWFGVDSQRR